MNINLILNQRAFLMKLRKECYHISRGLTLGRNVSPPLTIVCYREDDGKLHPIASSRS